MLQLIRHATLRLDMHGLKFLIDPFLATPAAYPPIQRTANPVPIPMIPLPIDEAQLHRVVQEATAIIVTHLHIDHWDAAAAAMVPKDKLLLTQPESMATLQAQGFTNVHDLQGYTFGNVTLHRTGGRHGTGETGQRMGPVSGVVFQAPDMRVYVAGDTIWCPEVADVLQIFQPDYVIVNAGAAQFLEGDPITMTTADIVAVTQAVPRAHVIAVHMDTVNHCFLTRELLRDFLAEQDLLEQVLVPEDGEEILL